MKWPKVGRWSKRRVQLWAQNWKHGIHLLFHTKRFGVDNRWWSEYDSVWAWPWRKRLSLLWLPNLAEQYKLMQFRAGACHFLNNEDFREMFGLEKHDCWS